MMPDGAVDPISIEPRLATPETLVSRLDEVLRAHGSSEVMAFLDRGEQLAAQFSGDDLRERALAMATRLEQALTPGAAALLVLPAGPDFIVALLGCLYAGIVAVPLPVPRPGAAQERLGGVLLDSGAAALLCRQATVASLDFDPNATPVKLVLVDEASDPSPRTARPARLAGLHRSPDDTVIVQYTSGSTRAPSGIALSSRNVLRNASYSAARWRCGPDDIVVSWLPHFHDMGLFGGILFPLLWGARSVQMSPLAFVQKPLRWLRAIDRFGATFSGGPAFAFGLCLDAAKENQAREINLSQWKVACCGGEPISRRLMEAFRTTFAPSALDPATLVPCYGLAEATLLVVAERDGILDHGGDDGFPIEACRLGPESRALLRIVDPQTRRPVRDGQPGEIWVKGPSVARGRFRADAPPLPLTLTLAGDSTPYLPTGDLGRIEDRGLIVTGRTKDILIAHGCNVAAVDLEWLAAEQDPALNPLAAAAFVRDPMTEQGACLVIEVRDPPPRVHRDTTEQRIRTSVAATFGIDLDLILFVKRGTLERTTSGKIRRHAVASRVRMGDAYAGARL